MWFKQGRRLAVCLAIVIGGAYAGGRAVEKVTVGALGTSPGQATAGARAAAIAVPRFFIENRGQLDNRVDYYSAGARSLYVGAEGLTFALDRASPDNPELRTRWAVKADFVGANREAAGVGTRRLPGVVSYFKGGAQHTGLPSYAGIAYRGLWDGVDLEMEMAAHAFKYTFTVRPGGDPQAIALAYRGADRVRVDEGGALEVVTPYGSWTDAAPVAYQDLAAGRAGVDAAWSVEPGRDGWIVTIKVGRYDPTAPLVIDPAIQWAGYLGGAASDHATDIALDTSGNVYVVGGTGSSEATFPETVGPDLTYNSSNDAFVAKLNASGMLIYVGYIGGDAEDGAQGVAVDGAGNAYVAGTTASTQASFPVKVGPDLTHNGGNDAFIAKVNSAGTALIFAGYIGGSFDDRGYDIALAPGTSIPYVTGGTTSTAATFPVKVGPDLTQNGSWDGFVAKVAADFKSLLYAGYIGGIEADQAYGIAVDSSGSAYVTGYAISTQATFPHLVGPDLTHNGQSDAFIAKLYPNGAALMYCGYIGGNDFEEGRDVAVDGSKRAYVVGYTGSTAASFPVVSGPDLTANGVNDAFATCVNPSGNALVYSGFIGGSAGDYAFGVAVQPGGEAYVAGSTHSDETTFPVLVGPDLTYNGGGFFGSGDAFVAKLRPVTGMLVYAGYVGGNDTDHGDDIAVTGTGSAHIVGYTWSTEATFPVLGGPDLTHNGINDAFVARITP
ncbi:MAG TPA: SBBP repeat-containing protein [Thermoanaerobaculia bacterium]|jgi:hypothetical protein